MDIFPNWLSVLERHPKQDVPEGSCNEISFNQCHLREWRSFLDGIKNSSIREKLRAVNEYGNRKNYVLDMDNYGMEDYWAIVKEFMHNGGDCEDYAITKLFSLRYLGVTVDAARIVVLMDTNLGVPHAVLAVKIGSDILILDNQAQEVLTDRSIVHYVPVFSINESDWWVHMPPG